MKLTGIEIDWQNPSPNDLAMKVKLDLLAFSPRMNNSTKECVNSSLRDRITLPKRSDFNRARTSREGEETKEFERRLEATLVLMRRFIQSGGQRICTSRHS